ncbi:MAG: DUF3800 domain-containing protein [Candidatus Sumerlaeota bacterium]|nr:DUF3800 domain-containing protein [Candidatus Sumerlaeota bacterium]
MAASNDYPSTASTSYVDESGDGVLFDRKGRVVLDRYRGPRHFMLGLLEVPDPNGLDQAFRTLRAQLLSDPYFRRVPSMQRERRKTALFFHAKDDIPEVRREVCRILLEREMQFFAVVKTMSRVLEYVRQRNAIHPGYRYNPNELYDLTVRMLFKNRLHHSDSYTIVFARRGLRDRTSVLRCELITAQTRFCEEKGRLADARIQVLPRYPHEEAGLQAVDYFLWAVQRLYESHEDRYVDYLWPRVALVHDVDDTREKPYGRYYHKKKPLTAAALGLPEDIG